ncbi:MAG: 2,3-bisphosphoglycerate-independent phosphoglycerate mutase, partial [Stellaceae bacterium]
AYARGETDEFVKPTLVGAGAKIADGDAIIYMNFRADRARQLTQAFVDPNFSGFERARKIKLSAFVSLTQYSDNLAVTAVAYPPQSLHNSLGEYLSSLGLQQLRIAETEKYAHVTFFFNGGRETVFAGEERVLVPSPRIATYDQQPEMSAPAVTDKVVEAIRAGRFDVIVLNYANADMVWHTGRLDAAVAAVEALDRCLGRLARAVEEAGGTLVVTADHGNAEMMRDPDTGEPHTAHTLNPVPLMIVNPPASIGHLEDGRLADVAPTLLALLGLPQPAAMTGHSLLRRLESRRNAAD